MQVLFVYVVHQNIYSKDLETFF